MQSVEELKEQIEAAKLWLQLTVNILTNPGAKAEVSSITEGEITTLRVDVKPANAGQVVGRQGTIARALRTMLSSIAGSHKHRYVLDIQVSSEEAQAA